MLFRSVFFFMQKTAYEMRISDWSSDVCSSDLHGVQAEARRHLGGAPGALGDDHEVHDHQDAEDDDADDEVAAHHEAAEGLDHLAGGVGEIGRASCRERVGQYV